MLTQIETIIRERFSEWLGAAPPDRLHACLAGQGSGRLRARSRVILIWFAPRERWPLNVTKIASTSEANKAITEELRLLEQGIPHAWEQEGSGASGPCQHQRFECKFRASAARQKPCNAHLSRPSTEAKALNNWLRFSSNK